MTLEEAKAVPHSAYIWVQMTHGFTQQFKTYNPGISNLKRDRVRLATQFWTFSVPEILDGQVLVEVTRDGDYYSLPSGRAALESERR
jgi:hypothetical protein